MIGSYGAVGLTSTRRDFTHATTARTSRPRPRHATVKGHRAVCSTRSVDPSAYRSSARSDQAASRPARSSFEVGSVTVAVQPSSTGSSGAVRNLLAASQVVVAEFEEVLLGDAFEVGAGMQHQAHQGGFSCRR